MVRSFYIIGACAWLAAGAVLVQVSAQWRCGDPVLEELRDRPGMVAVFQQREGQRAEDAQAMTSPLLLQAEMLANYLNPPRPVVAEGAAEGVGGIGLPSLVSDPGPPKAVSADFRVVAVSCYAERPERSMAWLEPAVGGEGKWVKQGEQTGHFVVHEISPGRVTLRRGEQRCELMVSGRRIEQTLVRDVRPVWPQANAAGSNSANATEARSETNW